jgi:Flp pilus assembly pilin Flp
MSNSFILQFEQRVSSLGSHFQPIITGGISMLEYLLAMFGVVRSDDEGQTAVEYALVLLLVALVLVAALALGLGTVLTSTISKITGSLG